MEMIQTVCPSGAHPQWTGYGAAKRDHHYFKLMLDQAAGLFLGGEPEAARLILRDVVIGTVGFEALAVSIHSSVKSLRGGLTANGRLGMDSMSAIFRVVRDWLQATLDVHSDATDQHFRIALE